VIQQPIRRHGDRNEEYMTVTSEWPGLFVEHPVPPVGIRDPLASFAPDDVSSPADRLSIGYGCLWEAIPERTWSGSAWNLREGLRHVTDTADIGVKIPRLTRTALKGIHTRYRGGRLTTSWSNSRLTDAYLKRELQRGLQKKFGPRRPDAVLLIDALARLDEPYFVYYDSSWDAMIASADHPERYAALRLLTPANLARRRDLQIAVYQRAAGVITMSHWLARCLIEQSGLPPAKVHVAHPGFSAGRTGQVGRGTASCLRAEREAPRRRLLFIGRMYENYDFYRKGGDLVVAALGILRRDYDPGITLTVVGMEKWPMPGPVPDGIDFRGILPPHEVKNLYQQHDLFVMPSRCEPFGVVFAEAMAAALPCVARNAYAMPEVVTPGVSGALIGRDDADELATAIAGVLADDEIYKHCFERAPTMAEYFSWERTARDVARIIRAQVGRA
jgi:glycosyltransferase involved in cell wall biosynthesis